MMLGVSVTILNVCFNVVLIRGLGPVPALGTTGAALGTCAANAVVAIVGLGLLFSERSVIRWSRSMSWKIDWPMIGALSMKGDLLARGAVEAEFRSANDLFDRIGGGAGPGGLKAVAPIGREQIFVTVPAGVDEVSVLIYPSLVGGIRPRSIFRAQDSTPLGGVISLKLMRLERLKGDIVWLSYDIVK